MKRVLLIRVGMLGDTIWGASPIKALLEHYGPETKIDLVVKKGMGGLFQYDPRVARVFEVSKRRLPLLLSPAKLRILLHSIVHPYELAIDLESKGFFKSLLWLLRTNKTISARAVRHQIEVPVEHAVDAFRKIIGFVIPNVCAKLGAPELFAPPSADIRSLFPVDGPYICLHFGNSWVSSGKSALRSWPSAHWQQLLLHWKSHFPNHTPVIIGTAAERELAASILAGIDGCIDLCGRTDVPQMMAVIAGADALVSTDTGPSHMAAALGIPVVSVFGPTQPRQTGPFDDGRNFVQILSARLPCSPCVGTPAFQSCANNVCMAAVTPDMVAASVWRLIRSRQAALESRAVPN